MTPAQLLSMALSTKGVNVSSWVIEEAAYLAGVIVQRPSSNGVADHIARHAALSEKASV